jgi:hypothetical protein
LHACAFALQTLLFAAQRDVRVADAALGRACSRFAEALQRAVSGQAVVLVKERANVFAHGGRGAPGVQHVAFRFLGGYAAPGVRAFDAYMTMEDDLTCSLCSNVLELWMAVNTGAITLAMRAPGHVDAPRAHAFGMEYERCAVASMLALRVQLMQAFGPPVAHAAESESSTLLRAHEVLRAAAVRDAGGLRTCDNPGCGATEPHPTSFRKCGRCMRTVYCGPACQQADWRRHKRAECGAAAAAPPQQTPLQARRAAGAPTSPEELSARAGALGVAFLDGDPAARLLAEGRLPPALVSCMAAMSPQQKEQVRAYMQLMAHQ